MLSEKFIHSCQKKLLNMADKIVKSESPNLSVPTQLPPQEAQIQTLLATPKEAKKPSTARISPPEIGTDAPKFTPTLPIPKSIEFDGKQQTLWRSQPVGGLWTNDQNMNGWAWFAQENWVRLSDANESGLMAMMMIAASGKETGSPCLYRREADGEIHELYIL
jgi:hypothetical protein